MYGMKSKDARRWGLEITIKLFSLSLSLFLFLVIISSKRKNERKTSIFIFFLSTFFHATFLSYMYRVAAKDASLKMKLSLFWQKRIPLYSVERKVNCQLQIFFFSFLSLFIFLKFKYILIIDKAPHVICRYNVNGIWQYFHNEIKMIFFLYY
jgi:hypothetical protein